MGRWDATLWSADLPLDALGRLAETIRLDILRYARTKPGVRTPHRLAAAVGTLFCLSPYLLTPNGGLGDVQRALARHAAGIAALSPEVTEMLRRVEAGAAASRRDPSRPVDEARRSILGGLGASVWPRAQFTHPLAQRYVQKIADRAARMVERELGAFGHDHFYGDAILGPLGALAIMEGWTLPRATVERWRDRMTTGWTQALAKNPNGSDMPFLRDELWPRTERLLELLLARV